MICLWEMEMLLGVFSVKAGKARRLARKIGHRFENTESLIYYLFNVKSHYLAEAMPRDRSELSLEEALPAA